MDVDDLRLEPLEDTELDTLLDVLELREVVEGLDEVRELRRLDFVEDWDVAREIVLLDFVELRELEELDLAEDFALLELVVVRELVVLDLTPLLELDFTEVLELLALDLFEMLESLVLDDDGVRELEVLGLLEPAVLDLVELRLEEVDVRAEEEVEACDELLEIRGIFDDELREDELAGRRDEEDDLPRVSVTVTREPSMRLMCRTHVVRADDVRDELGDTAAILTPGTTSCCACGLPAASQCPQTM